MSVSFNDHYVYTDENCRPLLTRIRREVNEWDNELIERVTSGKRIAYSKLGRKVFLEVKVQRHAIVLHMIEVPDPDRILSKIPASHGWHQLTRRAKIQTSPELEQILPLVRIAWQRG